MFKFYAFILSCLSFIFISSPAYAGRLLFWRFETEQNRLTFTTDRGVQPTAQLIANPTRLVIDLPGTVLGRPTINETYRGLITSLRIGQFDTRTTRLVIELASGYTLDPQQIEIKGISPTQWSVNLPRPQRGSFPSSENQSNTNSPSNNSGNSSSNTSAANTSSTFTGGDGLQITSSGLVIDLDGDYKNKINVERSSDRSQIKIEIEDLKIPAQLAKSWQINQYGISDLKISQDRDVATVTMDVNPDSPDWQATFMRTGGLLLWPQGGISRIADLSSNRPNNESTTTATRPNNNTAAQVNRRTSTNSNENELTTLDYLEVNFNQLIIKTNRSIQAKANWTNGNQVYQIRLDNTKLSPNFQSPKLPNDSPIDRLRIWEPDDKTVVLLVEPARNTQIQRLSQLRNNLWTLALSKSNNISQRAAIPVTPVPSSVSPWNNTPGNSNLPRRPIPTTPAPTTNRPITNSRALVVIDPGHGGKDPGAIGIGGVQEKHVVMTISQQVASILEQQGIQVRMTRQSDYFVSLQGRTTMANRINADLFVSIHANSAGMNRPQVSGYETFYFQSGRQLADVIHRNVIRRLDMRDRKVKQARFYVLRNSRMPSALVETGFLTGREDIQKLTNPRFQTQMAEAIASGIIEYIQAKGIR